MIWNKRKYYINNGYWMRTTHPSIKLAYDIWNYYNPEDKIEKYDGNVIHHINENTLDDRIENLLKLTHSEHSSSHKKGKRCSEETKNKMSKVKLGKESGIKGYKLSEQAILKRNLSSKFNFLIKKLNEIENIVKK